MNRRMGALAERDERLEQLKRNIAQIKSSLAKSMKQFRSNVSG